MMFRRRRRELERRLDTVEQELAILKAKYLADEITVDDLNFLTGRVLLGECASDGNDRAAYVDAIHDLIRKGN